MFHHVRAKQMSELSAAGRQLDDLPRHQRVRVPEVNKLAVKRVASTSNTASHAPPPIHAQRTPHATYSLAHVLAHPTHPPTHTLCVMRASLARLLPPRQLPYAQRHPRCGVRGRLSAATALPALGRHPPPPATLHTQPPSTPCHPPPYHHYFRLRLSSSYPHLEAPAPPFSLHPPAVARSTHSRRTAATSMAPSPCSSATRPPTTSPCYSWARTPRTARSSSVRTRRSWCATRRPRSACRRSSPRRSS